MKSHKYILSVTYILFLCTANRAQLKKDSLLPGKIFGIGMYSGMLPRVSSKNMIISQPVNIVYGVFISYSVHIMKNKPVYLDMSLDTESGMQKYSYSSGSTSATKKADIINYLTYINSGVGLRHLFNLKKQRFLSLYFGATLSYLTIRKQKQNDITSYGMRPINELNFAIPFNPEFAYIKLQQRVGYKIAGGVKVFTHDGPSLIYSRILPYITLGLMIH